MGEHELDGGFLGCVSCLDQQNRQRPILKKTQDFEVVFNLRNGILLSLSKSYGVQGPFNDNYNRQSQLMLVLPYCPVP